jgi:formamidopyrimidine-DNA glycosylase
MPELPEVETVVRQLNCHLNGKEITKLAIMDPKVVDSAIKRHLPFTINNIMRNGKYITFHLNNNKFLFTHLRMTGYFNINKQDQFTVAKFQYGDNYFTYSSIRKFGSIKLLNQQDLNIQLAKLGSEPLQLSSQKFVTLLQKHPNANIKTKLMDQTLISGIGNIYAQEALYYASINPQKKIASISLKQLRQLYGEIQRILKLAIKHNGSTVDNYSNLDGKGNFQNFLAVYNQIHCPQKHQLKKIKIGGRGTTYCPQCQT